MILPEWRLLDTGVLSGAENMALDDVVLECRAEGLTPNTFRFLQFNPSTALVGYHQSVEQEIRTEYVKRNRVDVNRRITGGGAILFTPTCLGWEGFAEKKSPGISDLRWDLERLAEMVCSGAVSGLERLGVEAEFRPKNDIEVNGRKISGTGGTERGDAFLYQGTLLVDFDVDLMLRSLRIPVEKLKDKEVESVKDRVTWLSRELEVLPAIEDIKKAFVSGFEQVFDVTLAPGSLAEVEEKMFRERLPYFNSDDWINLVRRPKSEAGQVMAVRKTPGGLIRVSIALDLVGDFIVSSFITGDFQVFPQRAILDLEARLKNAPAEEDFIRQAIAEFFEETGTRIFGVEPEDLVQIILEAIKKRSFVEWGVSLEESNHLMTVNFLPDQLASQAFDYVLLPYCAKLVDCDYRYVEGCTTCGDCTTSDIYGLAVELGVPVRTIQNFEHLMDTIQEFKDKGARGYVGSCCEGFYNKHHDDFMDTGVPMLLVDVDDSTCYDLGEEREAYLGEFEGQTMLKVDLLAKVVRILSEKGILRGEVLSH
ncbi:MAG: lipoyl protein ligase domain-containing protein [Candidatus Thorarchaeota archaeon]